MESPSSTVRRRAWINSSRQWPTLEEPEGPLGSLPSASIADDDVFSDGCFTGKIENWLLGCGSNVCSENSRQLSFGTHSDSVSLSQRKSNHLPNAVRRKAVLQANNLSDDLGLGADASVLSDGDVACEPGLERCPSFRRQSSRLTSSTPRRGLCLPSLNLGNSMASSCLSSSTWKTTSTVSEVLQLCAEDAEETLYELGFGCEEPQVTVRIPPRFFTFPSQAQGINFRLFLDSQLRRIREEDPSLSLASRFRQVQVLTAMANAFYSLYSHVSRTPLQKLATPEFTFSSSPVQRIERFRSSVRSEPRSPVERLKDTVNKMCLYTGSPRGSDSTSPQPSPRKRSSLPDIVDVVLKSKSGATKKLDLEECDRSNSAVDLRLITDDGKEEQTQQFTADTESLQSGNKIFHKEMQDSEQTNNADPGENCDLERMSHSVRTSLTSSLSGETVIETGHQLLSCQPELDSCFTQRDARMAELKPVAKVTYDLICPQIVECVHQAPFCCKNTHSPNTLPRISTEAESTDRSCPHLQGPISETNKDSHTNDIASSGEATQTDASGSLPVPEPSGSYAHYSITVTGWEGDDVSLCPLNTSESGHATPVPATQTRKESEFNAGERQYLKPLTHQGLDHSSNNLQQVNSFELEEVHSAGEEDFGQSDTTTTTETSQLSKKHQYKGEVVRGDSVQSDSSGYADEELSPSLDRHSR